MKQQAPVDKKDKRGFNRSKVTMANEMFEFELRLDPPRDKAVWQRFYDQYGVSLLAVQ